MIEPQPLLPPAKYRDKRTQRFAEGERVREFHAFKDQAERRLDLLEAATDKNDLMKLPSIRINQQWRICFEGPDDQEKPSNIEITDYH